MWRQVDNSPSVYSKPCKVQPHKSGMCAGKTTETNTPALLDSCKLHGGPPPALRGGGGGGGAQQPRVVLHDSLNRSAVRTPREGVGAQMQVSGNCPLCESLHTSRVCANRAWHRESYLASVRPVLSCCRLRPRNSSVLRCASRRNSVDFCSAPADTRREVSLGDRPILSTRPSSHQEHSTRAQ